MNRKTMVGIILGCILCANEVTADRGSEYQTKAWQDGGFSRNQSLMICARNERNDVQKAEVFTPDKVRDDLVGKSIGPVSEVKVKTGAVFGDNSGSSTGISSAQVYVPIPMDMVFDQTNITNLTIQDVKTSGNTATLVIQVETVSNYAGKLRLRYEYVAGEWVLRELENLSFKAQ